MKKLFLLFTLAFVAMSCEMIDEKIDDLLGKKDIVRHKLVTRIVEAYESYEKEEKNKKDKEKEDNIKE